MYSLNVFNVWFSNLVIIVHANWKTLFDRYFVFSNYFTSWNTAFNRNFQIFILNSVIFPFFKNFHRIKWLQNCFSTNGLKKSITEKLCILLMILNIACYNNIIFFVLYRKMSMVMLQSAVLQSTMKTLVVVLLEYVSIFMIVLQVDVMELWHI